MGYSPKGHKESDATERFYLYPRMPSTAASWAEFCCPLGRDRDAWPGTGVLSYPYP